MTDKITLDIRGMTCDDCASHVRQALKGVEGVQTVVVPGWREGQAIVTTKANLPDSTLAEAVTGAGYETIAVSRQPEVEKVEPVQPGEAYQDQDQDDPVREEPGEGALGYAGPCLPPHHESPVDVSLASALPPVDAERTAPLEPELSGRWQALAAPPQRTATEGHRVWDPKSAYQRRSQEQA